MPPHTARPAPGPRFATRPRLTLEHGPPERPPWRRGYGTYCIQAACNLVDSQGGTVGKVVGYDRYISIQDAVEQGCRVNAHRVPGSSCGPVTLTMLSDIRKECSGEVFFVMDGTSRRLF